MRVEPGMCLHIGVYTSWGWVEPGMCLYVGVYTSRGILCVFVYADLEGECTELERRCCMCMWILAPEMLTYAEALWGECVCTYSLQGC